MAYEKKNTQEWSIKIKDLVEENTSYGILSTLSQIHITRIPFK